MYGKYCKDPEGLRLAAEEARRDLRYRESDLRRTREHLRQALVAAVAIAGALTALGLAAGGRPSGLPVLFLFTAIVFFPATWFGVAAWEGIKSFGEYLHDLFTA